MFFKKKKIEEKKPELKKRKTILVFEKTLPVEVGQTIVEITFDDNSTFNIICFGHAYIDWHQGNDEYIDHYSILVSVREPTVKEKPQITNSLNCAKGYIITDLTKEGKFLNHPENPTEIRFGKVKSAKILESTQHEIIITLPEIVPNV